VWQRNALEGSLFRRHIVNHKSHVNFNDNEPSFPRLETTVFEPVWYQTIDMLNFTVVFIKCDTLRRDLRVYNSHCFDFIVFCN